MNVFITTGGKTVKQSETTLKELARRYRNVLLKCAFLNAVFFYANGTGGGGANYGK